MALEDRPVRPPNSSAVALQRREFPPHVVERPRAACVHVLTKIGDVYVFGYLAQRDALAAARNEHRCVWLLNGAGGKHRSVYAEVNPEHEPSATEPVHIGRLAREQRRVAVVDAADD